MKKILTLFILFFSLLISGCTVKVLEFKSTDLKMALDTSYQLEPITNYEEIRYYSNDDNIVTVSPKGLLYAKGLGDTIIVVSYNKQVVEIKVNVYKVEGQLNVYFIDVGQADAIFIELPNNETMMIDAGYGYDNEVKAEENLRLILDKHLTKKIDHFVITHNHSDHYGFVPLVISDYGIVNIYGSGSTRSNYQYLSIIQSIENAGLEYLIVGVGDILIETDDLLVQVVATQMIIEETDPNISSVMIRIVFGETAFMFTGDGGYKSLKDAENIALKSGLNLQADVLKVGHHGSRNSSGDKFLNAVKPKYAILTTSESTRDGLPTNEAMNRLKKVGATLYQTKNHGTIKVSSDGLNITVEY